MGRKSRTKKRKENQRRLHQGRTRRQELLIDPPSKFDRPESLPPDAFVVWNSPDHEKMSEVLIAFVKPYYDECVTKGQVEGLFSAGITAWNAALLSDGERADVLSDLMQTIPDEHRAKTRAFIDELVERKQRLFAGNRRFMTDFEVIRRGDDYHVNVMSSLTPVPDNANLTWTWFILGLMLLILLSPFLIIQWLARRAYRYFHAKSPASQLPRT